MRFLSELEEVVAAVVQHGNPIERHLVERRPPIELAGKGEQRIEKRGTLGKRPHHRIRKHHEVRPDRAVQTESALVIGEHRFVADGHHQRIGAGTDARVQRQRAVDVLLCPAC